MRLNASFFIFHTPQIGRAIHEKSRYVCERLGMTVCKYDAGVYEIVDMCLLCTWWKPGQGFTNSANNFRFFPKYLDTKIFFICRK